MKTGWRIANDIEIDHRKHKVAEHEEKSGLHSSGPRISSCNKYRTLLGIRDASCSTKCWKSGREEDESAVDRRATMGRE